MRAIPVALVLLKITVALAGPPAPGCGQGSSNGCKMDSDLLVFAEGDSTYEIVAHITSCDSCTPTGTPGEFMLIGDAEVTFGPYYGGHPCTPGSDTLFFDIKHNLREGVGTPETTYIPSDPSASFNASNTDGLLASCVDATYLDYEIPEVELTSLEGARTRDELQPGHATLVLPENVRSTRGSRMELDDFRLTQELEFDFQESEPPSSGFRFWPESLPIRLGPHLIIYSQNRVSFDTPGAPTGPTAYEYQALELSNLDPTQVVGCTNPDNPVDPCSWDVSNAGYFDSDHWVPSASRFDRDGMDLQLDLPGSQSVMIQPLFPQGSWVDLDGAGVIVVQDSRVAGDTSFTGGKAWLKTEPRGACEDPLYELEFLLEESPRQPRVTPDGGIVAGLVDLNHDGTAGQRVEWTFNYGMDLGCGTLWMPPPLSDVHDSGSGVVGPQRAWYRSARESDDSSLFTDPVEGRGIYAGVNYNRNRVCVDSGGVLGGFCAENSDCDTGFTCEEDRWSPLCPTQDLLTAPPRWISSFQKPDPTPPGWQALQFEIESTDTDEEMVFYQRASGITGVFDAGTEAFTIGEESDDQFIFEFTSFGHAFLASHAEWADTVTRGGLLLPWPSDATVPFSDMAMCDCGSVRSANTGEPPIESTLQYWDALFKPFGLRFSEQPLASIDCLSAAGTSCQYSSTTAKSVCIDADTPIPHFAPEPTSAIEMGTDGNPGSVRPVSGPAFDFEPNDFVMPYSYHAEAFALSDWTGASEDDVFLHGVPFGYYDAEGELAMPYFGLPDAGVLVQREDPTAEVHRVDLHENKFPDDPTRSYVPVERKIAGDSLPMSYRVDYFRPSRTADPNDGDDRNGRGLLLGYSWDLADPNLDLGSIAVPSALWMNPTEIIADVGPWSMTRLWGATTGADARDQLDTIVPAGHADAPNDNIYNSVLALFPEYQPYALPDISGIPGLIEELYARGAMDLFASHPDALRLYNTSPLDPGINAASLSGYLDFSPALDMVDLAYVDANLDTGGEFFAFDRSNLTVDRHVKNGSQSTGEEQPVTQMSRNDDSNDMSMPGEMSVPFPSVPGMQWDFEYDVGINPPSFEFVSLTGSLDLTQGGLSNIGFDKAGMTLKFWADGDWYFEAGLGLSFNGWRAYGDILLGNTKTMAPLQALDPVVADFLGGVPSFKGGYARVGAAGRIIDMGCLFNIGVGFEVGGWYINDGFGIKFRGFLTGQGICLISIRGDITLLGGEVGDQFKMQGTMWVAGGIGFCDPDSWDSPAAVLDDGACLACVFGGTVTGVSPPKMKLSMDGPDVDCSL